MLSYKNIYKMLRTLMWILKDFVVFFRCSIVWHKTTAEGIPYDRNHTSNELYESIDIY